MYDKGKCILESGTEGGHVLVRLGNDESLGRELRTYLQTEKYVRHKRTAPSRSRPRRSCGISPKTTRSAAGASSRCWARCSPRPNTYAAGQPLKLKATSAAGGPGRGAGVPRPEHVHQDGLPEAAEPGPRQGNPGHPAQQRHRPADARLRNWRRATSRRSTTCATTSALLAAANQQIVLHDMIEKRYAIRPYGWPDEEVLILVARLLVLGEISLMMDGALVPLERRTRRSRPRRTAARSSSSSGRRPTPRRSRTPAAWARNCSTRWGRTARTPSSPSCRASSRTGRRRCRLQAPGRHRQLPRQGRDRRWPCWSKAAGVRHQLQVHRAVQRPEGRLARPGRRLQ